NHQGDGAQTRFPFTFLITQPEEITAVIDDAKQDADAYRVQGVGQEVGGEVIFHNPPQDGARITLEQNLATAKTADLWRLGQSTRQQLSALLRTMEGFVNTRLGKAIQRAAESPARGSLTLPEPITGRALTFDAQHNLALTDADPDQILTALTDGGVLTRGAGDTLTVAQDLVALQQDIAALSNRVTEANDVAAMRRDISALSYRVQWLLDRIDRVTGRAIPDQAPVQVTPATPDALFRAYQGAMRSCFRYRLDLFLPQRRLATTRAHGVLAGAAGDDSLDVDNADVLTLEQDYILQEGDHHEIVQIGEVINATRVLTKSDLVHNYTPAARLLRTNWRIEDGIAMARDGDIYFSDAIDLEDKKGLRTLVVRRADRGRLEVFYRDQDYPDWTPVAWGWRRDVSDGLIDEEYRLLGR
ncbi:MAG: hypothetical protein AAF442_10265, partial [Pseudomonadota bacterium]